MAAPRYAFGTVNSNVRPAKFPSAAKAAHDAKKMIQADDQWSGDKFVEQSDALARG